MAGNWFISERAGRMIILEIVTQESKATPAGSAGPAVVLFASARVRNAGVHGVEMSGWYGL